MTTEITNSDNVIDSRDIIARIEELEDERETLEENIATLETERKEHDPEDGEYDTTELDAAHAELAEFDEGYGDNVTLEDLKQLAADCRGCSDWDYGAQLINEDYFTAYIENLIDDCYEMPKELNSGNWPYRHITIDYEAAAEEAKGDYTKVDFAGQTYLIR